MSRLSKTSLGSDVRTGVESGLQGTAVKEIDMDSVFIIEKLRNNGQSRIPPQYYYELSTAAKPRTTPSAGRAVALDGANWNLAAAENDARCVQGQVPVKVRRFGLVENPSLEQRIDDKGESDDR